MPTIALIAELTSVEGASLTVANMLVEYAGVVRAEPGNLVFAPNAAADDARRFSVYEEYRDEAAFKAHLATGENAEFNTRIAPLLEGGQSRLILLRPLLGNPSD